MPSMLPDFRFCARGFRLQDSYLGLLFRVEDEMLQMTRPCEAPRHDWNLNCVDLYGHGLSSATSPLFPTSAFHCFSAVYAVQQSVHAVTFL